MSVKIYVGDCRDVLAQMGPDSIQCVVTSPPYWNLRRYLPEGHPDEARELGGESSPELYVEHLVEVFRLVRRVCRPDATVWLNLGDSFADKQLVGIPWRVAFALQADGWWLRSDIIWSKKNPMPESVTDRPTKAHEYLFLLSKSKTYYYDQDAIREEHENAARHTSDWRLRPNNGSRSGLLETDGAYNRMGNHPAGRNKRSVWEIATKPFAEAHFACVSEDTECLTLTGWKRHNELRENEILAAYNLDTGRLRWEPLNGIAVYDYDGDLYKLGGLSLGMLCTPNHRCIVQTKAGRVHIRQADELTGGLKVPCAADWEDGTFGFGDDPGSVVAELIGWTVTDGHLNETTTCITQSVSANAHKVARIETLLNLSVFEYKKYIRHRKGHALPNGSMCSDHDMATFSIIRDGDRVLKGYLSPGKRIPPSAVMWSKASIRALFDGIVGGDGNVRQDGRIQIIQKDKAFVDAVQILAIRLGYRATVSKRKHMGWTVFLVKRKWLGVRTSSGSNISQVSYRGKVWCPSLASGTFVARRNGRVWITGNTFPPALVEPCIKAGTSEWGACPECGAPWERVVEKERSGSKLGNTDGREGALRNDTEKWAGRIGDLASTTIGWKPTCEHNADPIPCVILDPFVGAGTTLLVADRLGRNAIGIDLSLKYAQMAYDRVGGEAPLFTDVELIEI